MLGSREAGSDGSVGGMGRVWLIWELCTPRKRYQKLALDHGPTSRTNAQAGVQKYSHTPPYVTFRKWLERAASLYDSRQHVGKFSSTSNILFHFTGSNSHLAGVCRLIRLMTIDCTLALTARHTSSFFSRSKRQ
jgi:hypothetical protein